MDYFIDANVIIDFIVIGRLDLLVQLFGKLHVTYRVDDEIQKNRHKYEAWRDDFPVIYPEPEWESELLEMKKILGIGTGDVDRSVAIAAKNLKGILITRDGPLIKEAVKYLGMTNKDIIETVDILCMAVTRGLISKQEAHMYCDDICEKRCFLEDLDCSPIAAL